MRFFDPHIHMVSRTTDDYMAMYKAGVRAVIEPAFWLGQARTHAGSFDDYFQMITGWERFRASQFGIRHYSAICVNAKEANNEELAEAVMALLPRYLEKENVVAVGEIGYDDMTELEHRYFKRQLILAKERNLPVIVHTPHRDKKNGVVATIQLIKEVGNDPSLICIDHNNEETVGMVLEGGFWAGHTIYPRTKMDAERMVAIVLKYGTERILVNSSADWGVSNPLSTCVVADLLQKQGVTQPELDKLFWENPVELFSRSGAFTRAELETELEFDQSNLFNGNSVLRGQAPEIRRHH